MGVFSKRNDIEEPGAGGSGLHLDLDERYCPTCRRPLQPWQATCPDDGAAAVPRGQLPSTMPPPPAHLLDDDDR
jgi:predicted amidophosphoribosyltransferase